MTRSRPRARIPWLWLLVALVVVGLGVAAYVLLRPKATSANTPTVETATVQRGVFRVSVSGPGTLE
ncbi:MAG: efflux RND transporter periplasmic adaptor subunit, partial [Meiothermus sp.]|nr:efflux RND transporter periplasmic adaptor subunit [Meiothermus sp.]